LFLSPLTMPETQKVYQNVEELAQDPKVAALLQLVDGDPSAAMEHVNDDGIDTSTVVCEFLEQDKLQDAFEFIKKLNSKEKRFDPSYNLLQACLVRGLTKEAEQVISFLSEADIPFPNIIASVVKDACDGDIAKAKADLHSGPLEPIRGGGELVRQQKRNTVCLWVISILAKLGKVEEATAMRRDVIGVNTPTGNYAAAEIARNLASAGDIPAALEQMNQATGNDRAITEVFLAVAEGNLDKAKTIMGTTEAQKGASVFELHDLAELLVKHDYVDFAIQNIAPLIQNRAEQEAFLARVAYAAKKSAAASAKAATNVSQGSASARDATSEVVPEEVPPSIDPK